VKDSSPGLPSLVVSACSIALGMVVLLGWRLRWDVLVQPLESSAPMQPITAAMFALAGTAGYALRFGRAGSARVLALLLAVVPAVTLLEYATGLDTGLDEVLTEPHVTAFTLHPGRMAPNTALAFLACATSLGLLSVAHASASAVFGVALSATFAASLALMALVGYAVGIEAAIGWGPFTRMAVHTAAGLLMLSVDLIRATRSVVPRGLPAMIVGAAVIAASLASWETLAPRLPGSTVPGLILVSGLALAFGLASVIFLAGERRRLVVDLQRALTEVKTLSALLSACANCRQIRDETDDTWHPLETYLHRKGIPTRVSHGICPDCMERLYPQVARRLEERRRKVPV
jgi:hypothetical protein